MTNGLLRWAALLLLLVIGIGLAVVAGGVGSDAERAAIKAAGLRAGRTSDAIIETAQFVTWLGDAGQRTLFMVLAAAWLVWKKRIRTAVVMLVIPPLAGATSSILKEAFSRARPEVIPHLDTFGNFSYPSGHATGAAVVALLAALLLPTRGRALWMLVAVAVAAAIGGSRILLGVHWPSDVVAGWMLGTAFALGGLYAAQRWEASAARRAT